mgnify:CR=1 FL=1
MEEKSKVIFGNVMSDKIYKQAVKSKNKFIKKFGDDTNVDYPVYIQKNDRIGDALGVYDILLKEGESPESFDHEKGIIVGNIRMGFGHYRISMAMASTVWNLSFSSKITRWAVFLPTPGALDNVFTSSERMARIISWGFS